MLIPALGAALLTLVVGAPASPARASSAAPPASTPSTSAAPAQHWIGVAVEGIPPYFSRQVKLEPGQGLVIVKVMPGSPAEKARLQAGDILISVDSRPLTSQLQLATAANAVDTKDGHTLARTSTLGYIRDGERATVAITPAPRPTNWLVTGNTTGFSAPAVPAGAASQNQFTPNVYAAGDHSRIEVGPGIVVDLSSEGPSSVGVQAVRKLVANGQTIILSQDTDTLGRTRNTITTGGVVYPFDAGSIDSLPPELRELARNALAQPAAPRPSAPHTATRPLAGAAAAGTAAPVDFEERIRILEAQNLRLQRELETQSVRFQAEVDALHRLISQLQPGTPPDPNAAPQK